MRALNQADTITVELVNSGTGTPLTGIVAGDITLYYRKDGGASTEKTIDASNFREVDATNMPGVYEVDFSSSELNTRGEFTFVIAENGGVNLAQYSDTLLVGSPVPQESESYTLSVASGESRTFAVDLDLDGTALPGLTGDDVETDFYVNGTLTSNTIYNTLTDLGRGVYSLSLVSANTAAQGEAYLRVRPFDDIPESAVALTYTGGNAEDIWAVQRTRNQTRIVVADALQNDEIRISNDRGQTFTTQAYRSGGLVRRATGVSGPDGDPDVWVVAAYAPGNSLAYAYATQDGGQSYDELTDITSTSMVATRKIAVQDQGTIFYMLSERTAGGTVVFQGNIGAGALITSATFAGQDLYDVSFHKANTVIVVGENGGVGYIQRDVGGGFVSPTTTPAVDELRGVDFVRGGAAGWAVGLAGTVIYTTDDGDNWADQTANLGTAEDLYGVYALDANRAYVAGTSGSVFYTADAGATWTTPTVITDLGPTEDYEALYYADNAVYTSADLVGLHYEEGKLSTKFDVVANRFEITPAIPETSEVQQLRQIFQEELNRVRAGSVVPQGSTQAITGYFSYDGNPVLGLQGSQVQTLAFANGDPSVSDINESLFELDSSQYPGWYTFTLESDDTGVVGDLVVDFRSAGLAPDGTAQTVPAITATLGNTVYANSTQRAWIALKNGVQGANPIETSDGGDTWVENAGIGFEIFSVDGVPGTDYVFFGGTDSGQPYIYWTDDDGATTTAAVENTFSVFAPVEDVSAVDIQNAYGVADGYVLHLDIATSGVLLPILYSPGTAGLGSESFDAIYALDNSVIIAVGGESTEPIVVRTDDGGSSWAAIATGLSGVNLFDIDFVPGSQVGWIVGETGTVLKSVDGGATLVAQTSGTSEDLYAVWAKDENTAWIAGENVLLYTTDGGSTWTNNASLDALLTNPTTVYGIDGSGDRFWISGDQGGSPFIVRVDASIATFNPATFRFFVEPEIDLTGISDTLTDIQGAGFATGTHSLVQLRSVGDANQASLTDIQGAGFDTAEDSLVQVSSSLTDIQGATFDTATDSLESVRNAVDAAATDVTTTLNTVNAQSTALTEITTDLTDIQTILLRILGLTQENIRITGHVYDAAGNLTSATIRTYPTAQDVVDETNALATYLLTADYDTDNRLVDYSIRRA